MADTESEATYQAVFQRLKARGRRGVALGASDDHAGLRAAIARHFPGASWQRCQAPTCAAEWQGSRPHVAAVLEAGLEDCLACSHAPAPHRRRVHPANGLERFHQELKRRPRVVRIFPNRAALRRLATALAMEQSAEWGSGRRSLDMEPPEEAPAPAATAVAQAA